MRKFNEKHASMAIDGVGLPSSDPDAPAGMGLASADGAAGLRLVSDAVQVDRAALPELCIQAMTLEDVSDVAELEARIFPDPWSVDSFLAEVDRRPDIGWPLVVRDQDGRLAAYIVVWFIVDEVHIGNIAVCPDRQGRGLGKMLLEHVLDEGHRRGFLFATLEVRPSNTPALRLYERFGFHRVGVRANYYRNDGEDALVLAAAIKPAPLRAAAPAAAPTPAPVATPVAAAAPVASIDPSPGLSRG